MADQARDDLRIVVRYRKRASYGLHVLLGALDQEQPPGRWRVVLAHDERAARAEIDRGLDEAERVLVVWSTYSPDVLEVSDELGRLQAGTRPDDALRVTHVLGGPHASAEPEATLHAGFDLVALGEGEATFVALVAALSTRQPLAGIPGLVFLDGEGAVTSTGSAPRHHLDRFPAFAAAHHLYNPIEITRGCVYACRFCQTPYLFKARFRHRSVENVRAHVEHMRAEGMRYVRFITPTALSYGSDDETPNLDAVEALLANVREAIGPDGKVWFGTFPSEVRPEHVTPEALALITRYTSNDALVIGAQSGSDRVLDASNRGHTVDDVERAVRATLAAGLRPDVDLLLGQPGEEPDDLAATMALARRLTGLGARIHAHTFMPLPGTPWAAAAPGRVRPETRVDLDQLAARGQLYGQWAAQERIAAQVALLPGRRKAHGH